MTDAYAKVERLEGLVRELRAALKSTQFGFNHRRCPVCAGWNVGPHGETDEAHTAKCPVALALAKSAEYFPPPPPDTKLDELEAVLRAPRRGKGEFNDREWHELHREAADSISALRREVARLKEVAHSDRTKLFDELRTAEAKVAVLVKALKETQAWAHRIAGDERVCGWVHREDYGLYLLLADCPVNFDEAFAVVQAECVLAVKAKEGDKDDVL